MEVLSGADKGGVTTAPDRMARLAYGLGSVAFGAKRQLLGLLLFYYNQILGLRAADVGLVLAGALVLDAFWDPLIGQISDNTRSRLGRRHPYLYGVAVPLAVAFALLWRPPTGWSQPALLGWLGCFVVLSRLLISVHEIPSAALLPELATDYDARTRLLGLRYLLGTVGAAVTAALGFGVFLRATPDHPMGQLNAAGYAPFGATVAVIMMAAILISALGTHRAIPRLHSPPVLPGGLWGALAAMVETLRNRNFAVIALSGLLFGINLAVHEGLAIYFSTYFWHLTPKSLLWLGLAPLASNIAAAVIAPSIARRWGKKQACIGLFLAAIVLNNLPLAAALLDLMPPPGTAAQFAILFADLLLAVGLGTGGFIVVVSMIADITEESELLTGRRSEGVLIAAETFLQKAVGGLATILPGLLLTVVAFPLRADPATLDPQIMRHLALILLPLGFALGCLSVAVLAFYRIDRGAHADNLASLARRRAMV